MSLNPIGITEFIMYSTVKITTSSGTGTGYFFVFSIENSEVPVIVTNKHVINYDSDEVVKINFHLYNDTNTEVSDESLEVSFKSEWFLHPTHDLCCTPLVPIEDYILKTYKKKIYFKCLDEKHMFSKEELETLDAVESVLMVGYPIGLWDKKNNFPLFRQGITASHPALDFNDIGISVVDIASFPGSSGSPIFIYNPGLVFDKKTKDVSIMERLIFLGTLYAGPVYDLNGNIEIVEIPTSKKPIVKTQTMINLGYYIKASELNEFKEQLAKKIK